MERRLQILLDRHRYGLVEREAKRSGRSVAAVIREAIDLQLDDDAARRREGARRFLELPTDDEGQEEDWETIKAAIEDDLARADRL